MRLTPGGVRELHWHATAEWAIMPTGKARITNIDDHGRMFVADVGVGDLWFSLRASCTQVDCAPCIATRTRMNGNTTSAGRAE